MILTGKSKDDFLEWIYENDGVYFTDESMQMYNNALIIEWLDSVGLNILITCEFDFGYEILNNRYEIEQEVKKWYETRQEATIEAIKKANEIYNEL